MAQNEYTRCSSRGSCLHMKERKKWSLKKMFLRSTLVSLLAGWSYSSHVQFHWNVGCFCNRTSRQGSVWISLTMCLGSAALQPLLKFPLISKVRLPDCRVFATVGFFLHTCAFCPSTLINETMTVNILNMWSSTFLKTIQYYLPANLLFIFRNEMSFLHS